MGKCSSRPRRSRHGGGFTRSPFAVRSDGVRSALSLWAGAGWSVWRRSNNLSARERFRDCQRYSEPNASKFGPAPAKTTSAKPLPSWGPRSSPQDPACRRGSSHIFAANVFRPSVPIRIVWGQAGTSLLPAWIGVLLSPCLATRDYPIRQPALPWTRASAVVR